MGCNSSSCIASPTLGTPRPSQVFGQPPVTALGVVLHLAEVDKHVALISFELHVQALVVQLAVVADVLQPGDLVSEKGVPVTVAIQAQAFAQRRLRSGRAPRLAPSATR